MDATFSMEIQIDENLLRQSAYERALADGLDAQEACEYRSTRSLSDCVVMVLDPGAGPLGVSILGSAAEVHAPF